MRTLQGEKRLDMSKTSEATAIQSPVGGGRHLGWPNPGAIVVPDEPEAFDVTHQACGATGAGWINRRQVNEPDSEQRRQPLLPCPIEEMLANGRQKRAATCADVNELDGKSGPGIIPGGLH